MTYVIYCGRCNLWNISLQSVQKDFCSVYDKFSMNKNALGKIQLTNDILKKVNIQTPEIEKHIQQIQIKQIHLEPASCCTFCWQV